MTIRDLTPKAMRCGPRNCPSVHQLANGELLIVGRIAEPHEMAGSDIDRGDNEQAILIAPALLDDVPRGWRDIASAPRDGTSILIYWQHCALTFVGRWAEPPHSGNWTKGPTWRCVCDCGKEAPSATHWQPLPLPPTDREGA